MALAWACLDVPSHGVFLQSGLEQLAALHPGLQPHGRFGCPICRARGYSGWLRPAGEAETAQIAAYQGA